MKIVVVYNFPVIPSEPQHVEYAARFVATYAACPPGVEHDTVVACNAGMPGPFEQLLLSALPNLTLMPHDDSGFDIGAFQKAAATIPADLMVFFGGSAYFTKPGWLKRILEASMQHGPALLGSMGNQGDARVRVWPHVRTTGFAVSPVFMNRYPMRVTRPEQRHPFEHGPNNFTSFVKSQRGQTLIVGWQGTFPLEHCDAMPGGFASRDQYNLLFRDRIADIPRPW